VAELLSNFGQDS
jgi:AraC family transcriptional regulator